MSKLEGILALIGALIGGVVSAVIIVFFIKSVWFALLPFAGYFIGGRIGKCINRTN